MSSPTLQLSGSSSRWLSRRRKIGFSFIAFGVFLLAIPLTAQFLSLDWFKRKDLEVKVAERKFSVMDKRVAQSYLIEINATSAWLFTGLFVSPGDTLQVGQESEDKSTFGLRLNGQEFKSDGKPFGGFWIIQITDKKCGGCLIAKPGTHLYVSSEEPVTLRLEILK